MGYDPGATWNSNQLASQFTNHSIVLDYNFNVFLMAILPQLYIFYTGQRVPRHQITKQLGFFVDHEPTSWGIWLFGTVFIDAEM